MAACAWNSRVYHWRHKRRHVATRWMGMAPWLRPTVSLGRLLTGDLQRGVERVPAQRVGGRVELTAQLAKGAHQSHLTS